MIIPIFFLLAASGFPTGARQPQLAAAHGAVGMAFGSGASIYYASSPDQGLTWSVPVKVADATTLALGRHRGPRVAILKDAVVISAIVGGKGSRQADTLTAFRSVDSGKTWTRGGTINDVETAAREGLHAMAAAPDGTLYAVWLDLRGKGTTLYGSQSTDGGRTWTKNYQVYASPEGTICQCCHPSLSIDAQGIVSVMWRNAVGGSRDMYVTSSKDHFASAQKLGAGTWKLDACPMDGGGIAVENGQPISAWRRETDIYLAEGAHERRVGAGKDVALARSNGTYLAWTHDGGIEALTPKVPQPVKLAPEGAFATLVTLENGGVLAAWETHETIECKRLDP